ncbi:antiterminator Q family protein [Pseudomonas sp. SP16.1]|uniref:antiterminator Q family protein n=1 Tax=Pseudomonas sp. SP16.1 TaxID=3458854 RepID=UPI004045AB8A
MIKALADTEWMLEQWGWWRMSGMGVPRYVSPSFAIMRDNVQQAGGPSFSITDELAMAVDSCVARLCAREAGRTKGPLMGDLIWLYFGAKWPALRIAREYGVGEAKAREVIRAGVAWIDAALENLREAA